MVIFFYIKLDLIFFLLASDQTASCLSAPVRQRSLSPCWSCWRRRCSGFLLSCWPWRALTAADRATRQVCPGGWRPRQIGTGEPSPFCRAGVQRHPPAVTRLKKKEKKKQEPQCTKCLPLTSDSQRQSSLGCNVPRLGSQLRWLMFWRAERKLFLPSPDSPSAAPWLQAEPAAGSRSCQTHQYNTRLQCADSRGVEGVIRKLNRQGSDEEEERKVAMSALNISFACLIIFSFLYLGQPTLRLLPPMHNLLYLLLESQPQLSLKK